MRDGGCVADLLVFPQVCKLTRTQRICTSAEMRNRRGVGEAEAGTLTEKFYSQLSEDSSSDEDCARTKVSLGPLS